jgi:hypothetical protein
MSGGPICELRENSGYSCHECICIWRSCLQVEYAYVAPVNANALRDLGIAPDTVHEANFQAHTEAQHTSEL